MTIYKWWPSKGALALEGYFAKVEPELAFPDTGDIEADLRAQLHALVHVVRDSPAGRVIAQLIGQAQMDPELKAAYLQSYSSPRALHQPVLAGYDIGSRIAQAVAQDYPDLVRALVVSPPLPGVGRRVLSAVAQQEFWYQAVHQLLLADELIADRPDAVRTYLRHFWNHWSGPGFTIGEDDLDHLVDMYAAPGAFTASIAW